MTENEQPTVPAEEAANTTEQPSVLLETPVPTLDEFQRALEEARSQAAQYRDQLLRVRAEMDNVRKRHARELENAHKFALDGFVRELLTVADSLELGHTAAQEGTADLTRVCEGLALTLKLLGDVLTKFGVQALNPVAEPFNPDYHQAMAMQPCADLEPNRIVNVVQKGYTLNGRLVRPALVIVAQKPT